MMEHPENSLAYFKHQVNNYLPVPLSINYLLLLVKEHRARRSKLNGQGGKYAKYLFPCLTPLNLSSFKGVSKNTQWQN